MTINDRIAVVCHFLLLLTCTSGILVAESAGPNESGAFRLYRYEQSVGEEKYTITAEGQTLTLKTDARFIDFAKPLALTATLRTSSSYVPQNLKIQGGTSHTSDIDTQVSLNGQTATIRQDDGTSTALAPQTFFTISGTAPAAVQMLMMRYWLAHGRQESIITLPKGAVNIQFRSAETFEFSGNKLRLDRYLVRGLMWGMEELWMDDQQRLAALVTMDAGSSQFEAVRDEYASGLSEFVKSAAHDRLDVLTPARSRREGTFAFVGGTVIDGSGKPAIPNATVIISKGKIVAVGPSDSVGIPAGAERVDVGGKYIIPGLWDMHAHYEQVEWGPVYIAAGITTVRDMGTELDFIQPVRDAIDSGNGIGPRLLLAGIVDGDPATREVGMARINSAEDAQRWVQRYQDAGFQQIKIYSSVKPENVKAISTQAHKVGMSVAGHVPNRMNAYEAVEDGMDMISHVEYLSYLLLPEGFDRDKVKGAERMKVFAGIDVNSDEGKHAVEFFSQHGTVIDPTVALLETQVRPASQAATEMEPGIARVAPELRSELEGGGMPAQLAPLAQQVFQRALDIVGALHRAGVPVVAGTDQTVPGFSLYREIELYARAGFTPMEALQAATLVPARAMHVEHESGTIEAGKRADLVVLERSPLDDIHNVRSVRMVVAHGVLYDPKLLWESVGFKPE